MKIATLNALKKEMEALSKEEILQVCLQITRFKKENKELLNYLLFEANDEESYIEKVKGEIKEEFKSLGGKTFYQAKKSIRRILRIVKKYIKYSGKKETEIALLIFFCQELKQCRRAITDSKTIENLYQRQVIQIQKAMAGLHEDLQFDYQEEVALIKQM